MKAWTLGGVSRNSHNDAASRVRENALKQHQPALAMQDPSTSAGRSQSERLAFAQDDRMTCGPFRDVCKQSSRCYFLLSDGSASHLERILAMAASSR